MSCIDLCLPAAHLPACCLRAGKCTEEQVAERLALLEQEAADLLHQGLQAFEVFCMVSCVLGSNMTCLFCLVIQTYRSLRVSAA